MAIDHENNRAGAPSGVRLEENRLFFNNVSLESATAAGVLRRFPPDEWVGVFARMVDHGAGALEAAYSSSTVQLVTQQLDTAVAQMQQVMATTFTQGWSTAAEALQKMLAEHEKALSGGVGKYLDANSKTGLQAQMAEVFDVAGKNLLTGVHKAFDEGDDTALGRYFQKFEVEVQKGFASLAAQQAVKQHTETSTALAGVVYEEATFSTVVEIARTCGDVPEHCAASLGQLRKRNGDIVVGINDHVAHGADLRLVFELKRRADGAQSFTAAGIRASLKLAKDNRGAQAGIFLVEDAGLLPNGCGFVELGNADIATVYTPGGPTLGLAVAYRLARLAALADASRESDGTIDIGAAQRALTDIREGMTRLEQVRSQHNAAIGAIQRAGTGVQDLVDSVLAGLRRLDDILGG